MPDLREGGPWKWISGVLAALLVGVLGAALDRLAIGHQITALESQVGVLEERMEGRLIREIDRIDQRVTRLERHNLWVPSPAPRSEQGSMTEDGPLVLASGATGR